jgi:hypothetical protein
MNDDDDIIVITLKPLVGRDVARMIYRLVHAMYLADWKRVMCPVLQQLDVRLYCIKYAIQEHYDHEPMQPWRWDSFHFVRFLNGKDFHVHAVESDFHGNGDGTLFCHGCNENVTSGSVDSFDLLDWLTEEEE